MTPYIAVSSLTELLGMAKGAEGRPHFGDADKCHVFSRLRQLGCWGSGSVHLCSWGKSARLIKKTDVELLLHPKGPTAQLTCN